jgi:hypothetical protein
MVDDAPQAVATRLIPLARALEIIAARIPQQVSDASLDGLASTVSALVPLFVIDAGEARRLGDEELHKAIFRAQGTELHYVDGRPSIGNLAVTPEGAARVVQVLQGAELGP